MTTDELYRLAENESVTITTFRLEKRDALSIIDSDGGCYIAIDPSKLTSAADEKTKIAHELGHCVTGAFYNVYSPLDSRQRQENRADKWAIKRLVPRDELKKAVANGYTEAWQLAELFEVTEGFMRKAISLYEAGNLYSA